MPVQGLIDCNELVPEGEGACLVVTTPVQGLIDCNPAPI